MVHQFMQKKDTDPWDHPLTIGRFWLRRFWRIAPLYYPMLILSLTYGSIWGKSRSAIQPFYPIAQMDFARYSDRSVPNFLTHLTFSFGFLPHFAFRTPLPDWSIGLEFQFYAVFPLIMWIVLKQGFRVTIITVCGVGIILAHSLSLWVPSLAIESFLPTRIHLFGLGMLIGARFHGACGPILPLILLLPIAAHLAVSDITVKLTVAQIFLACFLYMITEVPRSGWSRVAMPVRTFLRQPLMQHLGIISYAVYLSHSLVILPTAAFLLTQAWYPRLPPCARFLVLTSLSACVVIPVSLLLYHLIERPGVRFGKVLIDRILPNYPAKQASLSNT